MRHHILTTALAAAVTALAYGQNLNPTVEVTNAYEGGAASIVKPVQRMAVPDSVMKFNLDFDYSVFEKPYQGAYEFKPYYVQLKPTPRPSTAEKFYLRLGAGFTLHPELDLVWTPVQQECYQVNVYATHRSYFGRYHQFQISDPVDGVYSFVPGDEKMKGYLADTKAGVDGAFAWDGGVATLDVGYRHRMADDANYYQKLGGIEARGRVRSLESGEPHFLYDAELQYHLYGSDFSTNYALGQATSAFTESLFGLDGTFGPVMNADHRLVADLDVQLARYRGEDYRMPGYTGLLSLTPKYIFNLDRWHFSLGTKFSWLIYSDEYENYPEELHHKSGFLFPDVHVDFHVLDDMLVLQASATGGDRFETLSGRFFSHAFYPGNGPHSLERVRAMLGFRGSVASRFRYDFQAGYARWKYSRMEGVYLEMPVYYSAITSSSVPYVSPYPRPYLMSPSFNLLFAELDYGWKSDQLTVDGHLAWRRARMPENSGALAPAAITGFIRPAFNWGERFKVGIDAEWSTSRFATLEGITYRVPGWMDLGLFAEYRFTHNVGFWLKGGNLLNQAVQRMPLHAEAGIYGTAGIVLNF